MKLPVWDTVVNVTQRSRDTLANITKKSRATLGKVIVVEASDTVNENTQRFLQTPFGRMVQQWSKPQKKQKKKRKISPGMIIFLGLFVLMAITSFIMNQQPASAAQSTRASIVTQSQTGSHQLAGKSGIHTTAAVLPCAGPGYIPKGPGDNPLPCDNCTLVNGNAVGTGCSGATTGTYFPCTQTENGNQGIATDWLSGDTPDPKNNAGHFQTTYLDDTLNQTNMLTLYRIMLGVGFMLLTPTLMLAGFQMILSASSFRYAEAITIISRVLLAGAALAICWSLISLLIGLSNTTSDAVVSLHRTYPYTASTVPQNITTTNTDGTTNNYLIGYTLAVGNPTLDPSTGKQQVSDGTIPLAEPASSYRGIVVPINRWGCAGNDFISIVAEKFWVNAMSSFIPFLGNFVNMTDKISSAVAVVHHLGEFMSTVLSVGLAAQAVFRIIMINFYVLMGPLALGCWGLPGGAGQKIVGQWFKGLCSLLFVQAVQLFVISVAPLIIPDLTKAGLPSDTLGLLNSILPQIPPLIVLFMALRVPKMLGTSAARTLSSAGTMASGIVGAAGGAIYGMF